MKYQAKTKGGQRLIKIAELLEKPASERPVKFDMDSWGRFKEIAIEAPKKAVKWVLDGHYKMATRDLNICGSAACALGHATLLPELHRAGLRIVSDASEIYGNMAIVKRGKIVTDNTIEITKELFFLDENMVYDVLNLWDPAPGNRTSKQVAKNIRTTVERVEREGGFLK
jgi:hypothetical protein